MKGMAPKDLKNDGEVLYLPVYGCYLIIVIFNNAFLVLRCNKQISGERRKEGGERGKLTAVGTCFCLGEAKPPSHSWAREGKFILFGGVK